MTASACILGCAGPALTARERDFMAETNPWGFILFARNVESPDQLRVLTTELRSAVGRDAPVLVDQEGGRVARMTAPHWREWMPPLEHARSLAGDAARKSMYLRYRVIANELRDVGIDVNCAPVLDIAFPDTHEVVRNRCLGAEPDRVALLGRAVAEGLLAGGVLPVIKHLPGHGRAIQDSHEELPVAAASVHELAATDFAPFLQLADLPLAMSAHVLYPAIDPERCATLSPDAIRLIREHIGFDGLLMTDDISMGALKGSLSTRVDAALSAGCDVILHCNGELAEMEEIASVAPRLAGEAFARAERALGWRREPARFETEAAEEELAEVLAGACHG